MPPGNALAVVADLWRYPIKSFGGERLRRAFVGPFGVLGDRRYAVMGPDGPMSARRTHRLLGFEAAYGSGEAAEDITVTTPRGEVCAIDDDVLGQELAGMLDGASPIVERTPLSFVDAAPLHILGLASIARLAESAGTDLDPRRFRANLLVETADDRPFEEDDWIGRSVAIGDAVIEVVVNTERCAVTTFDPDTRERDPRVLKALATTRENLFGVYARVVRPGWIATGDPVLPHLAG